MINVLFLVFQYSDISKFCFKVHFICIIFRTVSEGTLLLSLMTYALLFGPSLEAPPFDGLFRPVGLFVRQRASGEGVME